MVWGFEDANNIIYCRSFYLIQYLLLTIPIMYPNPIQTNVVITLGKRENISERVVDFKKLVKIKEGKNTLSTTPESCVVKFLVIAPV